MIRISTWLGLTRAYPLLVLLLILVPLASCTAQPQEKLTAQELDSPRQLAQVTTVSPDSQTRRQGEDWTSFLGKRGNGSSAETGVDPTLWKPQPPLVWTIDLGTSYGGPAIAQRRLLQFDRFGDNERLTCYEATTGKALWSRDSEVDYDDLYGYNNGPRCSPIIDDDRVYTYGVAGQLSCVELATGKPLWSKNLVRDYSVVQNFFGVASNPYVYRDYLLVMVGGSPEESLQLPPGRLDFVKPNGSAIVAFNKMTGEEVYRLGDDLASYSSLAVRKINGKDTALAFLRSGLLAWDPLTGRRLLEFPWRANMLESVNAALPVTSDDQVLLSEAYQIGSVLLQIKDDQPQVVWRDKGTATPRHAFRAHWATPILIDGYLYGSSGRNEPDSDFRCVRWRDGKVLWTSRDRDRNRSSVLFVDGYLIVLGEEGLLELVKPNPDKLDVVAVADLGAVIDPRDGRPLLSPPCWSAPILSHGLLYLRGRDKLICLELIPSKS